MARVDAELEPRDVADRWPRKVRCRWKPHKFIVWNAEEERHLREVGCIDCARDKMRADALRDRRPFNRQGGSRAR